MKRNTTHRSRALVRMGAIAFLVGGAALTAGEAHAGDAEVRKETVRYEELDLSRPAGAQALYRRLERAAARVCEQGGTPYMALRRIEKSCYQTALTNAVIQVNSPLLSQMHGISSERLAAKK